MERLTTNEFSEHAGCRHHIEDTVKDTIRGFFTNPPTNTTQSVFAQLRTALGTAVPTVTWTVIRTQKAMRSFIEDEN